jgi:dTDP-glucose 4,6-dehydratase
MAYHRQQGVDTAIMRIFNTYGPRMRPNDGRAIPTFLRQALQDRPITVFVKYCFCTCFCYSKGIDKARKRERTARAGSYSV